MIGIGLKFGNDGPARSTTLTRSAGQFLLSIVAVALWCAVAAGAAPRALPEGRTPSDQRLAPLKDLNGYFPFQPAETPADWEKRAERVRRQMLVSQGLWPMPEKTPLNAVIHGRIDQGDYSVEKVYFESLPGFYTTGSLYRPVGKSGKLPGVLCPHGHWSNGRFHDAGVAAVRREIVQGAERFENGGRSPLQARCMQLARMGCVVFHYDMIGYADSTQISFELAHRFARQRPEMNSPDKWGLFSPQAESRLQSVMGLQTLSSIRALDFLTGLPDVDPDRIAVTGASGGGTQTFMVCAVDPRPALAAPAVMVSTAMQGGCTCENASCLRVGTGNVEFAALFAPKPQIVTAADDWTVEMKTKGFPDLQRHYELLGAKDQVALVPLLHFGHNYNYVSRAAVYSWINKHFKLGLPEPIIEEDYNRLSADELTVWDAQHPRPQGGDDFERQLLQWWSDDADRQLDELAPHDEKSLAAWRDVVGGGVDALIGRALPAAADVEYEQTNKTDLGDHLLMMGLLRNKSQGEELPIAFFYPKQWEGRVAIWIDERGKQGLFDEDGGPNAQVRRLLANGVSVVGVDLLYQGEFLADGKPMEQTRRVGNPREAAAYTFGYNHSLFVQRVHDILSVITFVRNHEYTPQQVDLIGLGSAGPLVAAARAQARDAVTRAAIDTTGFRFAGVDDIHSVNFMPGGARYHDLPGMLALSAPDPLWIAGEGEKAPKIVAAAYQAAGGAAAVFSGKDDEKTEALVAWLLKNDQ